MMEAVRTSETSVKYYETVLRNFPEGCHFLKARYTCKLLMAVMCFQNITVLLEGGVTVQKITINIFQHLGPL
jgi:hypothetical protein